VQQDLANTYRKNSLLNELLPNYLAHGFSGATLETRKNYEMHIESFREKLNVELDTRMKTSRSVEGILHEQHSKHSERIDESCAVTRLQLRRVFARVKGHAHQSKGGSLSQEQEQEQEQEKEQEVYEAPPDADDGLPVLYDGELAFARSDEQPVQWSVAALTSEAMAGAGVFRRASDFTVYQGQQLDMPSYLWISNNWFSAEWHGARRLKNLTMLIEWIPNRKEMLLETALRTLASAPEKVASHICDKLWTMFAPNDRLTPDALHAMLGTMCVTLADSDLRDVEVRAARVNSASGLMHELRHWCTRIYAGRNFVAISLAEAEALRYKLYHAHCRGDSQLVSGFDVELELRNLHENGTLLDSSPNFQDRADDQLETACQIFRFMDYQTIFSQRQAMLLLRALQHNLPIQRATYHMQMRIGRRRAPMSSLKEQGRLRTGLLLALQLNSEFELLRLKGIALYLQFALAAESMTAKESMVLLDLNDDLSLQPDELYAALHWLRLRPSPHDVWTWIEAAQAEVAMEVSMVNLTSMVDQKLHQQLLTVVDEDALWVPPMKLSALPDARKRLPYSQVMETLQLNQREYSSLKDFACSMAASKAAALAELEKVVEANETALLNVYRGHDEEHAGPNPQITKLVMTYTFWRVNMPRCVEFHGRIVFAPDQERLHGYGTQHLVLEQKAYLYLRPLLFNSDILSVDEDVPIGLPIDEEDASVGAKAESLTAVAQASSEQATHLADQVRALQRELELPELVLPDLSSIDEAVLELNQAVGLEPCGSTAEQIERLLDETGVDPISCAEAAGAEAAMPGESVATQLPGAVSQRSLPLAPPSAATRQEPYQQYSLTFFMFIDNHSRSTDVAGFSLFSPEPYASNVEVEDEITRQRRPTVHIDGSLRIGSNVCQQAEARGLDIPLITGKWELVSIVVDCRPETARLNVYVNGELCYAVGPEHAAQIAKFELHPRTGALLFGQKNLGGEREMVVRMRKLVVTCHAPSEEWIVRSVRSCHCDPPIVSTASPAG
jgi:hypothetical protein